MTITLAKYRRRRSVSKSTAETPQQYESMSSRVNATSSPNSLVLSAALSKQAINDLTYQLVYSI